KIDEDDMKKGASTFSTDLVIEADREISDVMPNASKKIYGLLEEPPVLSLEELEIIVRDENMNEDQFRKLVECMIYFGILGLERDGTTKYIWDVGYDMDIIAAERQKFPGAIRFAINAAFWPALRIREAS